jgi:hypothetical protein
VCKAFAECAAVRRLAALQTILEGLLRGISAVFFRTARFSARGENAPGMLLADLLTVGRRGQRLAALQTALEDFFGPGLALFFGAALFQTDAQCPFCVVFADLLAGRRFAAAQAALKGGLRSFCALLLSTAALKAGVKHFLGMALAACRAVGRRRRRFAPQQAALQYLA